MKAQFFILGAILVCSMFFLAMPLFISTISQPGDDLPLISENMEREMPKVVLLGINESSVLYSAENFSLFMERAMLERRINFTSFWAVIQNKSTGINITALNRMGSDVDLMINLSPASSQVLVVPDGSSNSTGVSSTGAVFNITLSFGDFSATMETARDKNSMVGFYRLGRGDDAILNSVSG